MSKKLTTYTDEELEGFSNDQLYDILEHLEDVEVGGDAEQQQRKKLEIKLLHEFNEIKDATQIVLGALASIQGITIAEMHLKYNLPLKE